MSDDTLFGAVAQGIAIRMTRYVDCTVAANRGASLWLVAEETDENQGRVEGGSSERRQAPTAAKSVAVKAALQ